MRNKYHKNMIKYDVVFSKNTVLENQKKIIKKIISDSMRLG